MADYDDDDDNGSNASEEENEIDENMEDVDDGPADQDDDGGDEDEDAEGDDGDEGDDGEDEDGDNDEDEDADADGDGDDAESPSARMAHRSSRPLTSPRPLPKGSTSHSRHGSGNISGHSPSPRPSAIVYRPSLRPETITATTYDIVPTIAAPQSTSINCVSTTPDMRWVFSGGTDGYIRKFNWPDSANGKLALTVAQRHPFVDSVTKAGVLLSYWENEDSTNDTPMRHLSLDEHVPVSPVYSLAVQNQALWLLSGTEYGGINLQAVRHNEGTRITTLRKHTSAVSVLRLALDERSVLSGSWDKAIHDWDLNTGSVKRSFLGSNGQISAIEPRPQSSLPVPKDSYSASITYGTFSSNNASEPNGPLSNGETTGTLQNDDDTQDTAADDDDMNSLFGDDGDGGLEAPMQLGDVDDDEFSRAIAEGLQGEGEDEAVAHPGSLTGDVDMPDAEARGSVQEPNKEEESMNTEASTTEQSNDTENDVGTAPIDSTQQTNGLPHSADDDEGTATGPDAGPSLPEADPTPQSETTFLDACMNGTIRIWDRRQPDPIARIRPHTGTPPWCMSACWSTDGNAIYAGRRNNCVEEYNLHKGFAKGPERTFRFPAGSGPVSAVLGMPNGKHLICASHDILRLYDLQAPPPSRHSQVPFLIIPGHRTGIISTLYIDPTCTFLISAAGNRGWEGSSLQEVLLGYEIGVVT